MYLVMWDKHANETDVIKQAAMIQCTQELIIVYLMNGDKISYYQKNHDIIGGYPF